MINTTRINRYGNLELISFLDSLKKMGIRPTRILTNRITDRGKSIYSIEWNSAMNWIEYNEEISPEEYEKRWEEIRISLFNLWSKDAFAKDTNPSIGEVVGGFLITREIESDLNENIHLWIKTESECKNFYRERNVYFSVVFYIKEKIPTSALTYLGRELNKVYCGI